MIEERKEPIKKNGYMTKQQGTSFSFQQASLPIWIFSSMDKATVGLRRKKTTCVQNQFALT